MGTFAVSIEIGDPQGASFEQIEAVADTGAFYTMLPSSVLHGLGVTPQETESFELADGSVREFGIGETLVRIDGRERSTIVVFGEDDAAPLLGAYTLEAFMLGVDPVHGRLMKVTGHL